jgi:hypothetical protein
VVDEGDNVQNDPRRAFVGENCVNGGAISFFQMRRVQRFVCLSIGAQVWRKCKAHAVGFCEAKNLIDIVNVL